MASNDPPPDWTHKLAQHRTGLAGLSFAESTVVPIPLETIVAPLMAGHHRHSVQIAIAIWIGCLIGAALFYAVGYWLADPVVRPALEWLGMSGQLDELEQRLDDDGLFWTVFIVSVTPIPLQVATLGAGVTQSSFPVFIAAIALSRGIRYFGLALLARWFGPKIAEWNIPTGRLVIGFVVLMLIVWAVRSLV